MDMINLMLDWLSWAMLVAGGFFCLVGGIGMLRMPDLYTRLHASSVTETLGAGLILFGLMLQSGLSLVSVKLLVLGVLIFIISPTSTHAIARVAMLRGHQPLLHADLRQKGES
jgi:multicomponent Na+:H+ antiporter subunit G